MARRKICIVTGTRAEYHLLFPLIKAMDEDEEIDVLLAVTGAHLSPQYGNTYLDIEKDGFKIDVKIPILNTTDNTNDINHAISTAIIGFGDYFERVTPEMIVLLGDRYELLAAAIAAMNYRIPIAHLHGGETTEGAIDECIRHSISKMSYLHFTSCEAYRKRVIQLGEHPDRVFNVGALGIENIKKQKRMSLHELEDSLHFNLQPKFAVVTFHPVTLEQNTAGKEFRQLLQALDDFPDLKIIFTKSNADSGGLCINRMIDEYVTRNPRRCTQVFSLGLRRYISALQYASAVIGNSSSGITETPSFCVPTINIGDRQRGRIQAKNILNCVPVKQEISLTISCALSRDFQEYVKDTVNPFGDGETSVKIIKQIKSFLDSEKIELKKTFYDIDV